MEFEEDVIEVVLVEMMLLVEDIVQEGLRWEDILIVQLSVGVIVLFGMRGKDVV